MALTSVSISSSSLGLSSSTDGLSANLTRVGWTCEVVLLSGSGAAEKSSSLTAVLSGAEPRVKGADG